MRALAALLFALVAALLAAACTATPPLADADSDAPDPRLSVARPVQAPASYAAALQAWRGPQDLNEWIGARFEYDRPRALALSASQRARGPAPAIHEPEAFYARPQGVCVDLARFAVETLRAVAPQSRPRYLMIEFDPAMISGQTLRLHWVVLYETADGIHVFADSRRPGVISGPYGSVDAFVREYASYRGRRVVAYREAEDFRRRTRVERVRRQDGG